MALKCLTNCGRVPPMHINFDIRPKTNIEQLKNRILCHNQNILHCCEKCRMFGSCIALSINVVFIIYRLSLLFDNRAGTSLRDPSFPHFPIMHATCVTKPPPRSGR